MSFTSLLPLSEIGMQSNSVPDLSERRGIGKPKQAIQLRGASGRFASAADIGGARYGVEIAEKYTWTLRQPSLGCFQAIVRSGARREAIIKTAFARQALVA
jgi:hypothetical protein